MDSNQRYSSTMSKCVAKIMYEPPVDFDSLHVYFIQIINNSSIISDNNLMDARVLNLREFSCQFDQEIDSKVIFAIVCTIFASGTKEERETQYYSSAAAISPMKMCNCNCNAITRWRLQCVFNYAIKKWAFSVKSIATAAVDRTLPW